MPVRYRVIPRLNLVYVQYTGVVTIDERANAFYDYLMSGKARPGQSVLIDFELCTQASKSFHEIKKLSEDITGLIDPYEATMITSMFVPQVELYQACKEYQRLVSGSEKQMVGVFRTFDESLRFLSLSLDDFGLEPA